MIYKIAGYMTEQVNFHSHKNKAAHKYQHYTSVQETFTEIRHQISLS